jgi:hypothetical protein
MSSQASSKFWSCFCKCKYKQWWKDIYEKLHDGIKSQSESEENQLSGEPFTKASERINFLHLEAISCGTASLWVF